VYSDSDASLSGIVKVVERSTLLIVMESYTTGAVQILHGTVITEEANEDTSIEDDDFIGDLPPELDNIMIFSDAETDSNIVSPVLEEK